jgi:VIT1/CCC1 family predicted Fe2+/Mn2+ transporter
MAWIAGVRSSLHSSVGSIVFGMEDGVVSIFGLVFGVSIAAPNSHAVWLAGATGAAAAAVSMMAGTYLDVESTNDQALARLAHETHRYYKSHQEVEEAVRSHLIAAGFDHSEATTVIGIYAAHPATWIKVQAAVDLGVAEASRQSPLLEASWMFLADLLAAAVPVLPFAFLDLAFARFISLVLTLLLVIALGVGRSRVGGRRLMPTVAETMGIAAAAAGAGVLVGKVIA